MKKFTMLFVLALFLKTAIGQVTVNITVMNNLYPSSTVSGASVTLTGANTPTVISDANGLATFIVPTPAVDASYDLAITAAGYLNYSSSWDVYIKTTDVEVNSTVNIKVAYSVQFTVNDGTNPIQGANVRLVNSWPASDQTFTTNAQGIALTPLLYGQYSSLDYTISAPGFADSTGTVNIDQSNLVVNPIALKRAYTLTFTVNDGANPLSDAAITINNVTYTTDASGKADFIKMINGTYAYLISKPGFVDNMGTVSVTGADAAKTVSLASGYNVTFNVINGPDGTTGLAHDTITINGISKITDATGIVVFGVAPNSAVSFINKKAGFIDVPVNIASVGADMEQTINMVPVYIVKIRAFDDNSNPIEGASVLFNGITATSDMDGNTYFPNTAPKTDAYSYTVTGTGTLIPFNGEILLPYTSTEEYLAANNMVTAYAVLSSPGVNFHLLLPGGWMNYRGAATITFDGTDYPYDTELGSTINCALGTYSYTITPENPTKAIFKGSVIVESTTEKAYVGIEVVDGHEIEIYTINSASDAIEGATVALTGEFNGATVTTDASGMAMFSRYPAGAYTYSITKEHYYSIIDTVLNVNTENVTEVVTLKAMSYDGIHEVSAKLLKAYPNPTKGILYVNLPEKQNGEVTVTITNMIGSTLLNNKYAAGSSQIRIDASEYDNGIYFVKVKGNGFENTVRVVKN